MMLNAFNSKGISNVSPINGIFATPGNQTQNICPPNTSIDNQLSSIEKEMDGRINNIGFGLGVLARKLIDIPIYLLSTYVNYVLRLLRGDIRWYDWAGYILNHAFLIRWALRRARENLAFLRPPFENSLYDVDPSIAEPGISENQKKLNDLEVPDAETPEDFRCPISHEVMDEPVHSTGLTQVNFNEAHLKYWLLRQNIHPVTGKPLSPNDLQKNETLKKQIQDFVTKCEQTNKFKLS